jgi:hypothetical protein
MPVRSREVVLAARPAGLPRESDFHVVERVVSDPGPGELLVRNVYMSVDPYMRGRMNDAHSYAPPFAIGEPLSGRAVGQVVRSSHPGFAPGDCVASMLGWREHFVSNGAGLEKVDPKQAPISAYLGILGMPGFTAYVGLLDLGRPHAGETVFVSSAAGAVGSVVGQLARLRGCRAVGSTGSGAKVRVLLDEFGFDAAFDYKREAIGPALDRLCPDGIDVYFENVGGALLEAVLPRMKPSGRVVVCGLISQYNASQLPPGPNLLPVLVRRLTITGFLIGDHEARRPAFLRDMSAWLAQGRLASKETIVEGIQHAPAALIGLLEGENVGKMLVKVGPDPE